MFLSEGEGVIIQRVKKAKGDKKYTPRFKGGVSFD